MKTIKKLNHYDVFEVIDTFNIEKNLECEPLHNWLNTNGYLTNYEFQFIEEARIKLERKWDEWNEEELKMNFISLVFHVANVEAHKRISTFYERKFSGTVADVDISLVVDCMLASPTNSGLPKNPYFFMQEFKRSLGDSHDPEGQMLAAMILAQELNKNGKPLYGSWIQGRTWYFTVLDGLNYCVSPPFDAGNKAQLKHIVFILRHLKEIILTLD